MPCIPASSPSQQGQERTPVLCKRLGSSLVPADSLVSLPHPSFHVHLLSPERISEHLQISGFVFLGWPSHPELFPLHFRGDKPTSSLQSPVLPSERVSLNRWQSGYRHELPVRRAGCTGGVSEPCSHVLEGPSWRSWPCLLGWAPSLPRGVPAPSLLFKMGQL